VVGPLLIVVGLKVVGTRLVGDCVECSCVVVGLADDNDEAATVGEFKPSSS